MKKEVGLLWSHGTILLARTATLKIVKMKKNSFFVIFNSEVLISITSSFYSRFITNEKEMK